MEQAIAGQQAAFADRDFATARGFASEGFRSTVTTDAFEMLITSQYAFLLDDPTVMFERCAQADEVAEVEVQVGGATQRTLVYRLVRESGSWAIDAARITGMQEGVAA